MKAALILGNQLHRDHPALTDDSVDAVILIEAQNICEKLPYHKQKLVFLLSTMRHWADYASKCGKKVIYRKINDTPKFFHALGEIVKNNNVSILSYMRPADIDAIDSLANFCTKHNLLAEVYESKLFITPIAEIDEWFNKNPKSIMETFYRWQRKRLNILMDDDKPHGGSWNYDHENREPLPKDFTAAPKLSEVKHDNITNEVINVIEKIYPELPGKAGEMWLPVTFEETDKWLHNFITERLENFGKYEDAMHANEAFLYHSVLSPMINCGLISPRACVDQAIKAYKEGRAPLASVEGFVRQIIGWREFMYGTYRQMNNFRDMNYFGFTKELEDWWYKTDAPEHSNLPVPVKIALRRAHNYGYNHHIERLMVLGNWFLLNEYNPHSIYKWFSAMYVDAYEWVMVPNVIGMSQYADGGRVATKPYISGGNYLNKMGQWGGINKGELDVFTKLYWEFLTNNYQKLKNNHRMGIVLSQVAKRISKD